MKTNVSPATLMAQLGRSLPLLAAALTFAPSGARAANPAAASFFLHDGDRVCFYGDSITEQRFYGAEVQTYVRTRFPDLRVSFLNSGVGGDQVGGGWAGGIDLRLQRDVFPFKPTVVTIMLGMNDARYRPFDQAIFNEYKQGYEHLVASLQQHLPGVRIVLIKPTPYDDVTELPKFPGGYNAVLARYSAFVGQLATEHRLPCVDFFQPILTLLEKARTENPDLASAVIPKRIHPSAAGELVMAQQLLHAWNAPATVTAVAIDAAGHAATKADNTTVTDIRSAADGTVTWTQQDGSLPLPVLALHEDWPQFPPVDNIWGSMPFYWAAPAPKWDYTSPATAMIVRDCDFYATVDQEPLQVSGLTAKAYQLKINGKMVGTFTASELATGINLAADQTPMLEQGYRVLGAVWRQIQWRYYGWRDVQLKLAFDEDPAVQKATQALVDALEAQKNRDAARQYAIARPEPTHYELVPVKS